MDKDVMIARSMDWLRWLRHGLTAGCVAGLAVGLAAPMVAQTASGQDPLTRGTLIVTPGRTLATIAGNGIVGYSGDSGPAVAAALAAPRGVAFDAHGSLYFSDTANHVVRMVTSAGVMVTVAGNGVEGFSGDGGPATSAQLDAPSGIALDVSGSLYIADTRNHRIRKVTSNHITTIAGDGVAGLGGMEGRRCWRRWPGRARWRSMRAAWCTLPTRITTASAGSQRA